MEKEKVYLKGMLDFIIEQNNIIPKEEIIVFAQNIQNYANFLKQPIEIWQFIPCKLVDGNWVVLEEPKYYMDWYKWGSFSKYGESIVKECSDYHNDLKEAKEIVIFEGFELVDSGFSDSLNLLCVRENKFIGSVIKGELITQFETIGDLTKYNLELTQTAIKTLNL